MNGKPGQDNDLPVLKRVIKPGRVVKGADSTASQGSGNTVSHATPAVSSAAPAGLQAGERSVPAQAAIDPATIAAGLRAELEERIRAAVLDDIQYRLDQVIRDTLDRSLEPLLNEAVASVRQEIRDSLHGMVADSIDRAMASKAGERPD